jgi:Fur family ferric uptake transcriptional regulator
MVLQILHSDERRHLTAEDVHQRININKQRGVVALATVYRILSQLTGLGILERHVFTRAGANKAVYEIAGGPHHDHLICLECGRVDEFADTAIVQGGRRVAAANGYMLSKHQLALYGCCSSCRPAAADLSG